MLDWLTENSVKELNTVKAAPNAFFVAVLFAGTLIYLGLEWFHSEKYEAQQERYGALEERTNLLATQLDFKNEQLGDLQLEITDLQADFDGLYESLKNTEAETGHITLDNIGEEFNAITSSINDILVMYSDAEGNPTVFMPRQKEPE